MPEKFEFDFNDIMEQEFIIAVRCRNIQLMRALYSCIDINMHQGAPLRIALEEEYSSRLHYPKTPSAFPIVRELLSNGAKLNPYIQFLMSSYGLTDIQSYADNPKPLDTIIKKPQTFQKKTVKHLPNDCIIITREYSHVRRKWIHSTDKKGAGVVVIIDGKLLLVQSYGGKWNFPGGQRDYMSEDPMLCATRELQEETGILVPYSLLQPFTTARRKKYYVVYLQRNSVEIKLPESLEISGIALVDLESIQSLNVSTVVLKLIELIKKGNYLST